MRILTMKYLSQIEAVVTKGVVTPGFTLTPSGNYLPYCELGNILWDTGATHSLVCEEVVNALGLEAKGEEYVQGLGGIQLAKSYAINMYFENNLDFKNIKVLCADTADYDLVIGMDIISKGDFAITNKDEQTWFSFRYPSKEHLEFKEM